MDLKSVVALSTVLGIVELTWDLVELILNDVELALDMAESYCRLRQKRMSDDQVAFLFFYLLAPIFFTVDLC